MLEFFTEMISLLRNTRNQFLAGTYYIISNPSTIASSQICHETVPEKKKKSKKQQQEQQPRSQGFSASPGENPRRLRFTNIAALTSQASSLLTLVSLFKSWLCGPVKWLTEETTNQFKSNAASYLRVKNRSIEGGRERGREREREKKKSFPSAVESQQTYLTQVSRAEQNRGNVDGKRLPSPLRQPSVAKGTKN